MQQQNNNGAYVMPTQNHNVGSVPPSNFSMPNQNGYNPSVPPMNTQGNPNMNQQQSAGFHAQYHGQPQQQAPQQQPQQGYQQQAPQQQPPQGYQQQAPQQQGNYNPMEVAFLQANQNSQQAVNMVMECRATGRQLPMQQPQAQVVSPQQGGVQLSLEETNFYNSHPNKQQALNEIHQRRQNFNGQQPIYNAQGYAQSPAPSGGAVSYSSKVENSINSDRTHGVTSNANGDMIIDARYSAMNREIAMRDCYRNEQSNNVKVSLTPEQLKYQEERKAAAVNRIDHRYPRDITIFVRKFFPYKHSPLAIQAMRDKCINKSMKSSDALDELNEDVRKGKYPDCEYMCYAPSGSDLLMCTPEEIEEIGVPMAQPTAGYSPMGSNDPKPETIINRAEEAQAPVFNTEQNTTASSVTKVEAPVVPVMLWGRGEADIFYNMVQEEKDTLVFQVIDHVTSTGIEICRVEVLVDDFVVGKSEIRRDEISSDVVMSFYTTYMKALPEGKLKISPNSVYAEEWATVSLIVVTNAPARVEEEEELVEEVAGVGEESEEIEEEKFGFQTGTYRESVGFDAVDSMALRQAKHVAAADNVEYQNSDGSLDEEATIQHAEVKAQEPVVDTSKFESQIETLTGRLDDMSRSHKDAISAIEDTYVEKIDYLEKELSGVKSQMKLMIDNINETHDIVNGRFAKHRSNELKMKQAIDDVIAQTGAQGFKKSVPLNAVVVKGCSDSTMVTNEESTSVGTVPSYTKVKGELVLNREKHRKFVTQDGMSQGTVKRIVDKSAPAVSTSERIDSGMAFDSFNIGRLMTSDEFVYDVTLTNAIVTSKLPLNLDNKNEKRKMAEILEYLISGDIYKLYLGMLSCIDSVEKSNVDNTLRAYQTLDKHLAGLYNDAVSELALDVSKVESFLATWGCDEFEGDDDTREAIRSYITSAVTEVASTASMITLVSNEVFIRSPELMESDTLTNKADYPMMLSSITFEDLYTYSEELMINEGYQMMLMVVLTDDKQSRILASMTVGGEVTLTLLVA